MLVVKDKGATGITRDTAPAPQTHGLKSFPHCGPNTVEKAGRSNSILIVADDLTGACDAAAAFLSSGRRVRVPVDASSTHGFAGCTADVLAVTTESRGLPADRAAERVGNCISCIVRTTPDALLFKKIDSAARGNFASEIDAAFQASGAMIALVTPALPDAGRTVAQGILSIRDWTGQDTKVDLRSLFPAVPSGQIAVLPCSSKSELREGIARAIGDHVQILLCDAAEQSDLDRLAAAAAGIVRPLLWAGSAGLARALAQQLPRPDAWAAKNDPRPPRRAGRTLLFTGTPHPVTVQQIAHLEQFGALDLHGHARSIRPVADPNASSEAIIAAFNAANPGALILTGGDTASFVLRALGAASIRLAGEVEPGIPWGIIEGGLADGCTVVTKSGGFGQRDALVRAFEFCESESEAPLE